MFRFFKAITRVLINLVQSHFLHRSHIFCPFQNWVEFIANRIKIVSVQTNLFKLFFTGLFLTEQFYDLLQKSNFFLILFNFVPCKMKSKVLSPTSSTSWRNFIFCTGSKKSMTKPVPTTTLSNGVIMPLLGYGTFLSNDPEELQSALRVALDAGYRYIDTAAFYNNEDVIGDVLKEYIKAGKLKRSDLFIATKISIFGHNDVDANLKSALAKLKTDYIDLYLMHSSMPFQADASGQAIINEDGQMVPDLIPHIKTWRDLEKNYKAKTLRSIGVCNFNHKQLEDLYNKAEIKPHNLQIEIHILHQQHELVGFAKKLGISVTSYGTLGSPGSVAFRNNVRGNCLDHPLAVELAKKYNKTPAQILLRQIVQRGISVIPKSTNSVRVKQNISIFDFKLSDEDMKRFSEVKEQAQLFFFEFAKHHPWYPW